MHICARKKPYRTPFSVFLADPQTSRGPGKRSCLSPVRPLWPGLTTALQSIKLKLRAEKALDEFLRFGSFRSACALYMLHQYYCLVRVWVLLLFSIASFKAWHCVTGINFHRGKGFLIEQLRWEDFHDSYL